MPSREFAIIERYFAGRVLSAGDGVVLGPGDDAAILDVPIGMQLCVSTDTLIEGVHVPAGGAAGIHAHRAVAANLSDLAAMGARPLGCVLALTIPTDDDAWLEEFSANLDLLVRQYACPLVGGNLARGERAVTLTVFGTVEAGTALRRSTAAAGDDIWISGWPGEAAAGLAVLESPRDSVNAQLVARYERPTPRLALGQRLIGVASAAIDVSDGLMADLAHIGESSGLCARVHEDWIPLSSALRQSAGDDAITFALAGGDDYELCFTAPAAARTKIDATAQSMSLALTRIGQMVEGTGIHAVTADGSTRAVERGGYVHFDGD